MYLAQIEIPEPAFFSACWQETGDSYQSLESSAMNMPVFGVVTTANVNGFIMQLHKDISTLFPVTAETNLGGNVTSGSLPQ